MIRFECDYGEGAHPNILNRMQETNFMQSAGYGKDEICESARERIKKACGRNDIDVHFLVGGTQTNLTVISALKSYQGVLSAVSGHINTHETGAIEATGHKVLPLESKDGKISAQQVLDYCKLHFEDGGREHTVQPGMVYISHPTEYGTTYTKQELIDLQKACQQYQLPLFVDGARMGYGLVYDGCDLTLEDFAQYSDIFYIGGTKVGALFGEALIIVNDKLKTDFRYLIKQHGGMLAKGRLLGIQFDELFKNDLYFELSKHAVTCAMQIKKALTEKGIPFSYDSFTNQQFPLLTTQQLNKLNEKYVTSYIEKIDENLHMIRICTSWSTRIEDVEALITDIQKL